MCICANKRIHNCTDCSHDRNGTLDSDLSIMFGEVSLLYWQKAVQQWRPQTMMATNNDHDGHVHDGHKPWWPLTKTCPTMSWIWRFLKSTPLVFLRFRCCGHHRISCGHHGLWPGRRLCVFKVFIEYPLNLGSCSISMFSLNLTINKAILLFFSAEIATFWDINA